MTAVNPRRTLTFYFDFISHNAYIAWTQLASLASRHDLEIEYVPVLFGAILKEHGGLGPAEIPAKSLWMIRDVVRKAKLLGIPMAPPASHPFNPLIALRVSCLPMPHADLERLVEALFVAAWAERRDVSSAQIVEEILAGAGLDGPGLVTAAAATDNKARLQANTEMAVATGVFGVPTMIVDDVLFWGYDDWPHLERCLAGEDPLAAGDLEPWLGVRPSIQRRRG